MIRDRKVYNEQFKENKENNITHSTKDLCQGVKNLQKIQANSH